jgi:hypothetical protein
MPLTRPFLDKVAMRLSRCEIFRKIGIRSRDELTRVVVQRSADSGQGGADTYSGIPPQRRGRPYPSSW